MKKTRYWLFWEDRGYMDYQVFKTEKSARRKITESLTVFSSPILIEGRELPIELKKKGKK